MATSTEHIVTPVRPSVDTLSSYLAKTTEPIFTKEVLLGGLKAHGRIMYDQEGVDLNWAARYRRREVQASAGYNQGIDSPQTTTRRRASVPWRRFRMSESYGKFEKLANRGKARLFDVIGNLSAECVEDFLVSYAKRFFDDGNTTGSESLHGFESMFSYSALINAAAKCGAPNDVYGNLYTTLGYYGGDWTADTSDYWPTGSGSVEYGFWSPLIIDTTNTNWVATTKTFPNTWQEALSFAIIFMETNQDTRFDMCLMNPTILGQAKQSLIGTQRFELTQSSELTKMGFRTLSYEGIEVMSQGGVPAGTTYLFRWDNLSLHSMFKQLIDVEEDKDPNDSTTLYYFDNFSNMRFDSPAFFAKLVNIS
uniref:Capsid protein n=1 Tax=viral metagenome TaxID=1070528 RepID=A0A6M3K8P1_9ZZZZ